MGRRLAVTVAATAVLAACASRASVPDPTAAKPRVPAGYAESIARGDRVPLPQAELFVPADFAPTAATVPLCVHFQGGVKAAIENFARMNRPGVLIASTIAGRSSAFSLPYRDPAAFGALIAAGEAELSRRAGKPVQFGPILVTFWSAGYGAVRELLRQPEWFQRIDALVSADSIYASVVADDVRAPKIEDVVDFLRFAQLAARGEKTFAIAHGRYQTDYASTAESAALLRAAIAVEHRDVATTTERGVPIAKESHRRGFHCYEFAEATAGIHVDILYFVPEMVRRHVANAARANGDAKPGDPGVSDPTGR